MNLSKFEPHLAGGYMYIYRNMLIKQQKFIDHEKKKKLQKLMSYTSNTNFAKTNQNFKKVRHLLNTPIPVCKACCPLPCQKTSATWLSYLYKWCLIVELLSP